MELSDGTVFSFRSCYLPSIFIDKNFDSSLYTGREINSSEEDGFRFASKCLRAEKAALRLIARAEQTHFGISRKLENRGHEPACIQLVVCRLEELGLLDDSRFVKFWLESRLARRAGSPRRLLFSLNARGITKDDAESGLKAALDCETEWELLLHFINKLEKQKTARKNSGKATPAFFLKQTLKSEGFSPLVIQKFFEEAYAGEGS